MVQLLSLGICVVPPRVPAAKLCPYLGLALRLNPGSSPGMRRTTCCKKAPPPGRSTCAGRPEVSVVNGLSRLALALPLNPGSCPAMLRKRSLKWTMRIWTMLPLSHCTCEGPKV